tara:strand:+ start:291 stop:551 length:261 start_codon:yes stop_codon:yes gene_type:complete
METYQLFKYDSCPFCYRVISFIQSIGIEVETRDTLRDPQAYKELLEGGGRPTVPCLRILKEDGVFWLYESEDIIEYLKNHHQVSKE